MRRSLAVLGLVLSCVSIPALAAETPAPPDSEHLPVQVTWDVKIPMRDGVRLSATVYRDPRQTAPLPVILTMTPYIADHAAKQGVYFAQNGYVFVAVDSRGRGNSDGTFLPGQVEGRDGYDAVEWAARQPWCDGQVATWGGSWLGFTQWSIAKEFPPHLKAIAPTSSVYPGVDYPQGHGLFTPYVLRWLTYVHGRALNTALFGSDALWNNATWELIRTGRGFQELEDVVGIKGTVFKTWLAHPTEDAFWQAMTPRPEDFAKLTIPVLTIVGHYDADQLGALTYYERHLANGNPDVTRNHLLIIGPWNHGGTRRPQSELGGLDFGKEVVLNFEELHKAWYDHVLKGGPMPDFLKDRVACFIMGRNTWVYAPELSRIEGAPLKLSLDLDGAHAGDVLHGGRLSASAPAAAARVDLTADPMLLPDRAESEQEVEAFLKDQREAFRSADTRVVLHTEPMAAETVLAGRPRLSLRLAVDQPDADLFAELQEVLPDGSAVVLSDTSVRLRYRKGATAPAVPSALMTPGKDELIPFPPFSFFARSLAKGSRLRLIVTTGPYLGWQRNTNTGGDLATEPLSHGRVAHLTLMTGPGTGSEIDLPQPEAGLLTTPAPAG
jgi:putative CocE/NonD family hydrolase